MRITNSKITKIICIFICLILVSCTKNFTTTNQRALNVIQSCKNVNMDDLIASNGNPLPYLQFSLSTDLVQALLNNNQEGSQMLQNELTGSLIIFQVPFALAGVVLIFIWPYLCCCCCCCSNPKYVNNGKNESKQYSNCEMTWPVVILIILMLIVVVAGILGIIRVSTFQQSFQKIYCSNAIILDNIRNGNTTKDATRFFAGTNTISTYLASLMKTLPNVSNNLTNLLVPGLNNIPAQAGSLKTAIGNIPNGAGGSLILTYDSPIENPVPGSFISSNLPGKLGTTSSSGTLVGDMNTRLDVLSATAPSISSQAQTYANEINVAIPNVQRFKDQQITLVNNEIDKLSSDVQEIYDSAGDILNYTSIGLYILFAIILLIALLNIIAAICIRWHKAYKCRFLMYPLCFLIFTAALFVCAIAVAMSVAMPASVVICSFAGTALQSPALFNQTLHPKIGEQASRIASCLPNGDGKYFKNITNLALTVQLANIYANLSDIKTFATTNYSNAIRTDFSSIGSAINNALKTTVIDISDAPSLAIFEKLSLASNYACTASGFGSDSWIPSHTQTTVACKISQGAKSDSTTCSSTTNFQNRNIGCAGCIDSTSIQALLNTNHAGIAARFKNRYPGVNCVAFSDETANVWTNYYTKKRTIITPVQARRTAVQSGSFALIQNNFDTNIDPALTNVIGGIENLLPKFTDSTTGIIAGLDCKVIGENLITFKNVFCQEGIVNTYIMLIISGIMTFAFLFGLCCIVCIGVRSAQMENLDQFKYIDKKGPEQPVDNYFNSTVQLKHLYLQ